MLLRRFITRLGIIALILGFVAAVFVWHKLSASLPQLSGKISIAGIASTVSVESDESGIPTIRASSRLDAFRVLGFVTARDRLFQVDLMRRKSAGRLAEIFGDRAIAIDVRQRHLGFRRAATVLANQLPDPHKQVLTAYAEGFNEFLSQTDVLPFEFIALGYQPEIWKPEDSMLVALAMFQQLTFSEPTERMLTVMKMTLPQEVVSFLTPDTDEYDSALLGGALSHRPAKPIPIEALVSVLKTPTNEIDSAIIDPRPSLIGSNNWAVNRTKTFDGRAILSNDMHLELSTPIIWYRAVLRFDEKVLSGIMLPGLPLLIAGSNGKVAWGHTNVLADVVDLVRLEINPDNPSEYLTKEGMTPFNTRTETIRVKNGVNKVLEVRDTIWGPVSPKLLAGQPVAVRWTALLPEAVNMEMFELDRVQSVDQAIGIFNRSGIPPTNVLLADDEGRIAWTLAGRFPRRVGFDGAVSHAWSRVNIGWAGYIEPDQLPRIVDPPSGFLITANNRTLGSEYPYIIGHNFGLSYRAFRIGERLKQMNNIREQDLFDLQLDTTSEFYEFYRRLALEVITTEILTYRPEIQAIKQALQEWNGKADSDSRGLPILAEFRVQLARRVISPFLKACKLREPSFSYRWFKMETPLRSLLTEKIPATLPDRGFKDWDELILETLMKSATNLKKQFPKVSLNKLTWGKTNETRISHPFSRLIPFLSNFLDMPISEAGGCSYCVKVVYKSYGATERMVVSPNNLDNGILHMPTGQSGHPLSPHYDDQQHYWQQGLPLGYNPGSAKSTLLLVPPQS